MQKPSFSFSPMSFWNTVHPVPLLRQYFLPLLGGRPRKQIKLSMKGSYFIKRTCHWKRPFLPITQPIKQRKDFPNFPPPYRSGNIRKSWVRVSGLRKEKLFVWGKVMNEVESWNGCQKTACGTAACCSNLRFQFPSKNWRWSRKCRTADQSALKNGASFHNREVQNAQHSLHISNSAI